MAFAFLKKALFYLGLQRMLHSLFSRFFAVLYNKAAYMAILK